MRHRHRPVVIVIALLACVLLTLSCSGPQPLSRAIRPSDETAYLHLLDSPDGPREAFYQWRASRQDVSVEAARTADEQVSDSRNPFNARKDPVAVSRGAVIYKHQCLRCHGVNVDGKGPETASPTSEMDFRRFGRRFSITLHGGAPSSWFAAILDGTDSEPMVMPPFKDVLAREQIWQAVTYLQSFETDLAPASNGQTP